MIPIYQPFLNKKNLQYAHKAIDSTWISNIGEYKDKCSNFLKDFLKIENCILVNNGTSATHLVYKSLKFKNPDLKNILVPNNVYVAAWNSMIFDNDDINLIPIKTNIETWNIDIEDLISKANEYSPKDTAILIVHNLGGIVNVPKIKRLLPEFTIVEDNCEGFLGKYESKFSGTESFASSISFYGNKNITCGEGGAIFFNNKKMFNYLNKIHSQGQSDIRYIHDILGYNYRLTNVQAAILFGQLQDLKTILENKKRIFSLYRKQFKNHKNLTLQKEEENCENSNWIFAVRIKNNKDINSANAFFNKNNIETRSMFYPMSYHSHLHKFSNKKIEEVDNILLKEVIMLPSGPNLKTEEILYISKKVIEYSEKL